MWRDPRGMLVARALSIGALLTLTLACSAVLPTGHIHDEAPTELTLRDIATPASLTTDERALWYRAYARHPWLQRLPNGSAIAAHLARRILLARDYERLFAKYRAMPDPDATIVSYDRELRARQRAPVARKLRHLHAQMIELDAPIHIEPRAIVRADFVYQRTRPDQHAIMELAGRRAVWELLPRSRVTVRISPRLVSATERAAITAGRQLPDPLTHTLRVELDGASVRVHSDGLHLSALLDDPHLRPALNRYHLAYYAAATSAGRELLYAAADRDPSIVRDAIARMREEGYKYELRQLPDDERLIRDLKYEQRQRAARMTEEAQRGLAPAAMVASLFVIDGAVDLVLTVVPIDKLGRAFKLGKRAIAERRASRRAAELRDEFANAISKDVHDFIKLASHLTRSQIRALKRIHTHTDSEMVIRALTRKQANGDADVRWIAKMLDRRKIDAVFIRRFTFDADLVADLSLYNASPSWRVLQRVIERKPVPGGQRSSLASKLKGMLGERAAAAQLASPTFITARYKLQTTNVEVRRGVRYSGQGSIDILGTYENKVVFAEVKNWSASTWNDATQRVKLLGQLDRHDEGVPILLRDTSRRLSDVLERALILDRRGYRRASEAARAHLEQALKERGWNLIQLDLRKESSLAALIDDLR